jgi:hypothetical protein
VICKVLAGTAKKLIRLQASFDKESDILGGLATNNNSFRIWRYIADKTASVKISQKGHVQPFEISRAMIWLGDREAKIAHLKEEINRLVS